jgi:hypothetical protein
MEIVAVPGTTLNCDRGSYSYFLGLRTVFVMGTCALNSVKPVETNIAALIGWFGRPSTRARSRLLELTKLQVQFDPRLGGLHCMSPSPESKKYDASRYVCDI